MSLPPLTDVLRSLAAVFDGRGLRWYLFGAQAVVIYGQPRLSADVDVTVETSPDAALALLAPLRERGFETRVDEPASLLRRTRVLPLFHRVSGLGVDLVVAGPEPPRHHEPAPPRVGDRPRVRHARVVGGLVGRVEDGDRLARNPALLEQGAQQLVVFR